MEALLSQARQPYNPKEREMKVFDGDPNELEWHSGSGVSTVIAVYSKEGLSRKYALSGKRPPSDEEFLELMQQTKELSKEKRRPLYLVLFRVKNGLNSRFTVFAEFFQGNLSAYCRPPWRKGEGIF